MDEIKPFVLVSLQTGISKLRYENISFSAAIADYREKFPEFNHRTIWARVF